MNQAVNSNNDPSRKFQILALSGGGYRGLNTAIILDQFEKHFGKPIGQHFDLISGTSIGGIIALAVACEIPMSRVVDLFRKEGSVIFSKVPFWKSMFGLTAATYSSEPLKQLLADPELFGDLTLGSVKHPVIIPTLNFSVGKPWFFKSPHHEDLSLRLNISLVDIALATSAAPSFFPPHKIGDAYYVDGGLFANSPILSALHEAEVFFHKTPKDVRLLGIGTMSSKPSANPKKVGRGGIYNWAQSPNLAQMPKNIINLTLSAQEQHQIQIAQHRFRANSNEGNFLFLDELLTHHADEVVGLDQANPAASSVLGSTAENIVANNINHPMIKNLFKQIADPVIWYHGIQKNSEQSNQSHDQQTAGVR